MYTLKELNDAFNYISKSAVYIFDRSCGLCFSPFLATVQTHPERTELQLKWTVLLLPVVYSVMFAPLFGLTLTNLLVSTLYTSLSVLPIHIYANNKNTMQNVEIMKAFDALLATGKYTKEQLKHFADKGLNVEGIMKEKQQPQGKASNKRSLTIVNFFTNQAEKKCSDPNCLLKPDTEFCAAVTPVKKKIRR